MEPATKKRRQTVASRLEDAMATVPLLPFLDVGSLPRLSCAARVFPSLVQWSTVVCDDHEAAVMSKNRHWRKVTRSARITLQRIPYTLHRVVDPHASPARISLLVPAKGGVGREQRVLELLCALITDYSQPVTLERSGAHWHLQRSPLGDAARAQDVLLAAAFRGALPPLCDEELRALELFARSDSCLAAVRALLPTAAVRAAWLHRSDLGEVQQSLTGGVARCRKFFLEARFPCGAQLCLDPFLTVKSLRDVAVRLEVERQKTLERRRRASWLEARSSYRRAFFVLLQVAASEDMDEGAA